MDSKKKNSRIKVDCFNSFNFFRIGQSNYLLLTIEISSWIKEFNTTATELLRFKTITDYDPYTESEAVFTLEWTGLVWNLTSADQSVLGFTFDGNYIIIKCFYDVTDPTLDGINFVGSAFTDYSAMDASDALGMKFSISEGKWIYGLETKN